MEVQCAALLLLNDGDIVEFFEFAQATPESVPMFQGRFTICHIRTVGQRDHAISTDGLAGFAHPLFRRPPRHGFIALPILGFAALGLLVAGVWALHLASNKART